MNCVLSALVAFWLIALGLVISDNLTESRNQAIHLGADEPCDAHFPVETCFPPPQ